MTENKHSIKISSIEEMSAVSSALLAAHQLAGKYMGQAQTEAELRRFMLLRSDIFALATDVCNQWEKIQKAGVGFQ